MFNYIISLLLGYFIGSFPTAYILVKWKARIDIRTAGSGNVGTMNTFDVTRSKMLSLAVLLIDLVKGVLAVAFSSVVLGNDFAVMGVAGVGAVVGHNYSPWLKFKGGRGLATSAGVMLVLGWIFVPVWCAIWTIIYLISKNIHTGNILASVGTPLVFALMPEQYLSWCILPDVLNTFMYVAIVICTLILLRHLDFLGTFLKSFHKPL